jgi:hypothetical protein
VVVGPARPGPAEDSGVVPGGARSPHACPATGLAFVPAKARGCAVTVQPVLVHTVGYTFAALVDGDGQIRAVVGPDLDEAERAEFRRDAEAGTLLEWEWTDLDPAALGPRTLAEWDDPTARTRVEECGTAVVAPQWLETWMATGLRSGAGTGTGR